MRTEKKPPESDRAAVVVLYDAANGRIAHVHYCAVEAGAELPGRAALEQSAIEHARRHGLKGTRLAPEKLAPLHLDASSYPMDRLLKVDVRRRALVEVKRGRPGRSLRR